MKTEIRLFNTETRQKELFKPLQEGQVKLYTCGPTVYNFAHIGNLRTYMFEDLLRRTLEYFGYEVTQVMNLTDVDDKTIKGATALGVTLNEFTKPFIEAFFEDLETLNIHPAAHYPKATDFIPPMVEVIQALLDKGVAYQGQDGSVYYSISHFPRYGCLSHLKLDDLQAGASERVANDEYDKDNASDFVLWKGYDPKRDGEIFWDSPFGKGRPGWHLECSVMAMQLLGKTVDIHCGGVDNIFPHHENEIAQSESYSGERFVKYWLHSEHLIVEGKKMSKSLGNFYTLKDLLHKGYLGPQIRLMLLQTHYKTQLNFTFAELEGVKHSLGRLNEFIQRLLHIDQQKGQESVADLILQVEKRFSEALADDLNISVALAALFDLVREGNTLCDKQSIGKDQAESLLQLLRRFNTILGVLHFEKVEETIPAELHHLLDQRNTARAEKNWPLADQLRATLESKGYLIEDTPQGARLKAK